MAVAAADRLSLLEAALREGSLRWVDLTHPLRDETPIIELPEPYANTPGWSLEEVSNYDERGPLFYWNSFSGSEHMGTHLDAPIHWITGRGGDDVARIPPERLVGAAVVVDRTAEVARDADYLLTISDLERFQAEHGPLPKDCWLLYRTGWSARYWERSAFLLSDERGSHWPGVEPAAARFLAEETEIRGLGVEQIGIDAGWAHELDPPWPAHHYLLGNDKYGARAGSEPRSRAGHRQLSDRGPAADRARLGEPGARLRARPRRRRLSSTRAEPVAARLTWRRR
jgi:kynurenine formamidase